MKDQKFNLYQSAQPVLEALLAQHGITTGVTEADLELITDYGSLVWEKAQEATRPF